MKKNSVIPTHQPRTYRNRLLRLADVIEKNEKRFNWNHWVGDDYQGKPDLSCGTTACALGWATTMPELRKEGLCLRGLFGTTLPYNTRLGVGNATNLGIIHFGLTEAESDVLFFPGQTGNGLVIIASPDETDFGLYQRFAGDETDGKAYAEWLRAFVRRKDELIRHGHSAQWGTFKPRR